MFLECGPFQAALEREVAGLRAEAERRERSFKESEAVTGRQLAEAESRDRSFKEREAMTGRQVAKLTQRVEELQAVCEREGDSHYAQVGNKERMLSER
jgi:hypothetical protein